MRGTRAPRTPEGRGGVDEALAEGMLAMIFGEVGEAKELLGVVVTVFASLFVMVMLGKFWET